MDKSFISSGYGKELILDIHECDVSTFTRASIKNFCKELCDLIDMEACEFHFWDFKDDPEEYEKAPDHIKGISAIQFITTSNITIHTLDVLGKAYINIFSCKNFDAGRARSFTVKWFGGWTASTELVRRI